jgi:2-methylisocitrate lyase-like PEP mutase family enzyme
VSSRQRFRQLLAGSETIVAPGVYDCISARLVAEAGFQAALITGAGIAASVLGLPDVGLMTMSEVLAQTRNICRSVDLPLMADCDTGYGNAINVMRTVREFQSAGVAGLFIEDQVSPKRCGHFEGKELVSTAEMCQKLRAAVEARSDPDLVLMARTDARAVEGLSAAIERARRYVEAGADMLFVEAPETRDELAEVGRALGPLRVPLLTNLVEGGKTPLLPVAELGRLGFKMVSYSGSPQRTAIKAIQGFLASLKETGGVTDWYPERMVGLGERSRLLGLPEFYELEQRFAAD